VGLDEGDGQEEGLLGLLPGHPVDPVDGGEGDFVVVVDSEGPDAGSCLDHFVEVRIVGKVVVFPACAAGQRRPSEVGGHHVARQPLLEAVELIGPHEVHLA